MTRCVWILPALVLMAVGCGKSAPPPPAVTPAPVTATATDAPEPDPVRPPTIAATPPAARPSADNSLRSLLARYLDADGQGGWHLNDKAATEVEKLAPQTAQLISLASDPQIEVRRGAAFCLMAAFDSARPDQVTALIGMLADEDHTVRSIGRSAISQMQPADQIAAVPKLAALLAPNREAKSDNRAAIARLFGGLKRDAASALPELSAAAAGDPDAKVRAACYAALAQVAAPADAVAPLVKGLADRDPAVRVVASAQLRKLSSAAAPAAKELAAALADAEQRVRENATEALILIGPLAVEPLAGALAGKQVEAKKYALVALAKIGPPAKSALPAIEKLSQDADENVKKLAAEALKRIGP